MSGETDARRLAYIVTRFPKITETFVLYEILALLRSGANVDVYSLIREREPRQHPEAARLQERTRYPALGRTVVDQARWLARSPRRYAATWWAVLRGTASSPKFLLRSLVVTPAAASFAWRMRDRGVEHVHAHWATHGALAAFVVHRLTGIPYSFTAHAHDIYVDRTMLDRKIREAAFVVTISEYNRRLLERLYPEAAPKIAMIRCGVDLSVFRADARERGPIRRLICVASLQPQKGHAVLLRALAILRARGRAMPASLVGEGPERTALERLARQLGVDDLVTFHGSLPQPQVAELLRTSDAAVQPSIVLPSGKTEGIPVALMEALASGLPVVASDVSGIPELVRDEVTGLLVPAGDAEALADAVARLADDPELGRRLGAAGRAAVTAEFDLRANAERLRTRILSALSPGRP